MVHELFMRSFGYLMFQKKAKLANEPWLICMFSEFFGDQGLIQVYVRDKSVLTVWHGTLMYRLQVTL